jgi:hypothetical protein
LKNAAYGWVSGLKMTDEPCDAGSDVLEQLEPFPDNRRVEGAEPRNVAPGSCEALDKTQRDGIDHEYENDRYRMRLLPQRHDRWRGDCQNCIGRQADQLCRIGLDESWILRGKAVADLDILRPTRTAPMPA